MKYCEGCYSELGIETPEGFKVKLENHKEEFIVGKILQITCHCGMVNYIREDK